MAAAIAAAIQGGYLVAAARGNPTDILRWLIGAIPPPQTSTRLIPASAVPAGLPSVAGTLFGAALNALVIAAAAPVGLQQLLVYGIEHDCAELVRIHTCDYISVALGSDWCISTNSYIARLRRLRLLHTHGSVEPTGIASVCLDAIHAGDLELFTVVWGIIGGTTREHIARCTRGIKIRPEIAAVIPEAPPHQFYLG
jgi:hypothetical protein